MTLFAYWKNCSWIASAVRQRVGADRYDKTIGVYEHYEVKHLVVSDSAGRDLTQASGLSPHATLFNCVPDPSGIGSVVPDDDPPIVLAVASVQPRKGPDTFVEVAAIVCEEHPSVRFVWLGGSEDGELANFVAARGLQGKVEFVKWSDDPGEWMSRASVLLVPSRSEAFGLIAAEAMARFRTVVTFDGIGTAEVVADGGVVVPQGDAPAMAATVCDILEESPEARPNGRARRRYETTFQPSCFAKTLGEIMRDSHDC